MRIGVIGLGYVGATAAACLAAQGHWVTGVDPNENKVRAIRAGRSPITEPGVPELIAEAVATGSLDATTAIPKLDGFDVVVVCVGTPSAADGSHNMSHVAEATRQLAAALPLSGDKPVTVTYRSTFRPGTMAHLVRPIFERVHGPEIDSIVELVYNPEFLRESSAIYDFHHPPKIVVGTNDGNRSTAMDEMHNGLNAPTFYMRFAEAEITKFVDNTWHAVKVAFANEIGRICDRLEIDAAVVHEVFVSDTKLNISPYYLRPGGPFGGSCLPKDVRALAHIASSGKVDAQLISSLMPTNDAHKTFQVDRVVRVLGETGRVLVLGLAFKAGTDDLRESPNVDLVRQLVDRGYNVRVYEPALIPDDLVGQNLGYIYSHLPEIDELLVDEDDVIGGGFDLAVLCNATGRSLNLGDTPVLDLSIV